MKIIRSDEVIPIDAFNDKTMFLAGPTPRSADVPSWRPDAIKVLEQLQYPGTVFIPEPFAKDYNTQVEWEYKALECCNLIVFWVPRNLDTMPAFTTNVEFGRYVGSKRIIYGRPNNSVKNDYLDWLYNKLTKDYPVNSLEELLIIAMARLNNGV